MRAESIFFCVLITLLSGCMPAVGRTRALIQAGELEAASAAAGDSWRALREVSQAIIVASLGSEETRREALRAVEALGAQDEQTLRALVRGEDPLSSSVAAAALLRLGLSDADALIALLRSRLEHRSAEVRAVAVGALGRRVGDEAFFRAQLADGDERVRGAALEALGRRLEESFAEALLEERAAEEPLAALRARALRLLGRRPSSLALVDLAGEALGAQERTLHLAAVAALGRADDRERARALLRRAAESDDEAAAIRASTFLAAWGEGAAMAHLRRAMLEGDSSMASAAALGAGQAGPEMVEALRDVLERGASEVRLQAATALLGQGDQAIALAALHRLLDEPGWVGVQAALALARADQPSARGQLIEALSRGDVETRVYVAAACAFLPEGISLARQGLTDRSPRVRLSAAAALLRALSREG